MNLMQHTHSFAVNVKQPAMDPGFLRKRRQAEKGIET